MLRHIVSTLCLVFILSYSDAQDLAEGINWFEQFYRAKQSRPTEEALSIANNKLQEARDAHDQVNEASALKELGMLNLTRIPDYEQAIEYLISALEIEDSLRLKKDEIVTYLAMARVFEEVGDYPKSAELLEHAVELSRPFNDIQMLAYLSMKLGKINALRGRTENALENYDLILKNRDALASPKTEAEALFNIAHVFELQKKFDSAMTYHKKALNIRRRINDRINEAQSLNDIGELYKKLKNNQKALDNHVVALKIRTELKDKKGLAQSYNNVGVLYYEQKNFQRSIANLELALDAGKESQSNDQSAKSYEFLSLCYKELGDYARALQNKESYLHLVDLLRNEKAENELLETQNRYVLDKKELEIKKLELLQRQRDHELKTQRKFQNFLFVLIGLGITVILLVFYLYLVKRRSNKILEAAHAKVNQQNEELQSLNATKDKFFSIISHDLKGPLNSFTAFSSMLINHTESLTKEEIQMLAKEIDKNLKNLFALLENLLEWSRSQTGNISFQPEIIDLNELLIQNKELLTTQAKNKGINIEIDSRPGAFVSAHKQSVNTVIRNLISNAIKFTPEGGTIQLDLSERQGLLTVSVSDTGVGMTKDVLQKLFRIDTKYSTNGTANEKGTGLGLILCKDFIEKNGGTIGVESEPGKGSKFHFTLKGQHVQAEVLT